MTFIWARYSQAPDRGTGEILGSRLCVSVQSAVFNFQVTLATEVNLAAILFFYHFNRVLLYAVLRHKNA